jgi:hypothetical protein
MTDKTKLKTRAPSTQFLEETKPPEFVPRARVKKDRAWYRPQEDEAETPPPAAPEPVQAPPPRVQEAKRAPAPASPAPASANGKSLAESSREHAPAAASRVNIVPAASSPAQPTPSNDRASRKGASSLTPTDGTRTATGITSGVDQPPQLSLDGYTERALALITRAQGGCPHEYLFRQILMFEMSTIDASGEFGTLALSRNGLEQLFGISEGGVKKAKKEMEAYNLISTMSVGTRGAPTVFKVFSPYLSSMKQT